MELIKTTSAALAAKLAEIDGINAQIDRAQAAIDAGIPGQETLAGLQTQRQNEIGKAFMEDRQPDLAVIDKAIAKLEKDAVDAKSRIAGARSALTILSQQAAQAQADLPPLQQAQDEAINAYAHEKDAESIRMLDSALAAVTAAFNHMAAAEAISRKPRTLTQQWLWQHRLYLLQNGRFNVKIDSGPQKADLVAELTAAGVVDAGNMRVARTTRPAPSLATPDPVVTFTYAATADGQAPQSTVMSSLR